MDDLVNVKDENLRSNRHKLIKNDSSSKASDIQEKVEKEMNMGMSFFSLAKGFAIAAHITGYIVGPLVFFLAVGLLLDKYLQTYPMFSIIAVIAGMIISNILIFKKAMTVLDVDKYKDTTLKKSNKDAQ